MVHTIYLVKLALLYAPGGLLVATWTSGLSPWDIGGWWDQPIVYQKLVLAARRRGSDGAAQAAAVARRT